MAKLYNLARMTTATTGTGTITLGSAVSGYLTFAQAGVANADVVDYAIKDGSNSEIGTGTYTSSGTTLTRTVTKSTNSNAAINLSGSAEVFISPRAETLNDASVLTSGTLSVARINGGTANDQVQGDGSFVTQARKLINTLTASSSATLSDTACFSSSFSVYEIVFTNCIPATNAVGFQMQVYSGGSYQTTSYNTIATGIQTSMNVQTGETSQISLIRTTNAGLSNTTANGGYSGTIRIYNPSGTASYKAVSGQGISVDTITGTISINLVSGWWANTAAVTGFRVQMSSGNIASGTVKIYGLN